MRRLHVRGGRSMANPKSKDCKILTQSGYGAGGGGFFWVFCFVSNGSVVTRARDPPWILGGLKISRGQDSSP